MTVGLTGGYCTGKNRAEAILRGMGFVSVDVDRLGHEALSLSHDAVVDAFGPSILGRDGLVDRRKLGAVVFGDPASLGRLEAITHPAMFSLVDEWLALNPGRDRCINAFVLYKMPQAPSCDLILEIWAPFLLRLARGMKRDGLSPFRVIQRIVSQRALLARGSGFGNVMRIENSGSEARLAARIRAAIRKSPESGAISFRGV